MLERHHLAAEEHLAHRIRGAVVQTVEGADKAQGGYRPDEGGDLVLTQKVQQLLRPGKEPPGNHNQGGLSLQGSVDILDRDIKIKGSLIADAVI